MSASRPINRELATEKRLFLLPVLGNINNLVLEDEKIRPIVARNPHHVFVVILDPSAHNFAVGEFKADDLLLFAQRLQIISFFKSFVGRRRSLLEIRITGIQRHLHILQRAVRANRGSYYEGYPEVGSLPCARK